MQIAEINYQSSEYPDSLREIASPPRPLYALGHVPNDRPLVAIVGSRTPTAYGAEMTTQLARELVGAGVVIVSGLAYGIDTIAHTATLEAGGTTIAVMAGGLDEIYPLSNRELAKSILASRGALISEHPAGTPPLKQQFASRNRIIAGLSLAVIVPEAAAKSGSLITANFALEQNRLVMAVPGNATSLMSAGPNNLLRAGAIPITSATDVLDALGLVETNARPMALAVSAEEAVLLDLLRTGHHAGEALIRESGFSASQFAGLISLMEITGKVRNLGAGQWVSR